MAIDPVTIRPVPTAVQTIHDTFEARDIGRSVVSWRAIFAGAFISLLTYSILMSLGLAIGGASLVGVIEGEGGGQALGIGSGVWLVVSTLISLFVGSYLASRSAGMIPMRLGRVHGLVVCSLFFIFMLSQLGSGIGLIGRGVGSSVGAIGSAGGDLASNPQVQNMVEDQLGDLPLKASPEVVVKGLTSRMVRGDTEGAKNYLARQAGISPQEADTRIKGFQQRFEDTAQDVGTTAARTASIVGWTLFGALLLGALASMLGGGAGAKANQRQPVSGRDERNMSERKAA